MKWNRAPVSRHRFLPCRPPSVKDWFAPTSGVGTSFVSSSPPSVHCSSVGSGAPSLSCSALRSLCLHGRLWLFAPLNRCQKLVVGSLSVINLLGRKARQVISSHRAGCAHFNVGGEPAFCVVHLLFNGAFDGTLATCKALRTRELYCWRGSCSGCCLMAPIRPVCHSPPTAALA